MGKSRARKRPTKAAEQPIELEVGDAMVLGGAIIRGFPLDQPDDKKVPTSTLLPQPDDKKVPTGSVVE
jgi:hypothetical protein